MSENTDGNYDRGAVFDPTGRVVSVEYAREAVKRGATIVSLVTDKGVLVVADKKPSSKFVKPESIRKIHQISENKCIVTAGLVADGRILVNYAIQLTHGQIMLYDEEPDGNFVAEYLGLAMHQPTQYGGMRPYGTMLQLISLETDGIHLYEIDPMGSYVETLVSVAGKDKQEMLAFLEENWNPSISLYESLLLVVEKLGLDLDVAEIAIFTRDSIEHL